jgi:hypothetical protein
MEVTFEIKSRPVTFSVPVMMGKFKVGEKKVTKKLPWSTPKRFSGVLMRENNKTVIVNFRGKPIKRHKIKHGVEGL